MQTGTICGSSAGHFLSVSPSDFSQHLDPVPLLCFALLATTSFKSSQATCSNHHRRTGYITTPTLILLKQNSRWVSLFFLLSDGLVLHLIFCRTHSHVTLLLHLPFWRLLHHLRASSPICLMELPPSPITLAPFLLRNVLLPLFIYINKSLLHLTHKLKLFAIIRYTLVTAFLLFLKIFPSSLNSNHPSDSDSDSDSDSSGYLWVPFFKGTGNCNEAVDGSSTGDTCIARALTQLLAIINEIPVSSRKYDIVQSYAEKLMKENLEEGFEPLRRVNATVLSGAFSRALGQLESAAEAGRLTAKPSDDNHVTTGGDVVRKRSGGGCFTVSRVLKTVGHYRVAVWTRFMKPETRLGGSADKLSAELLWLALKLAACGSADEAVRQWASASKLASVALSAPLRFQGSLVRLSAFLLKQATCIGGTDEVMMEELRKVKMKMLMTWLPFLCGASNGTDAPILSFNEKADLEMVLGDVIGSLKHEEQEKVLSLWLHHFTHCPSADWPNLHPYYARWCTTSRKLFILQPK